MENQNKMEKSSAEKMPPEKIAQPEEFAEEKEEKKAEEFTPSEKDKQEQPVGESTAMDDKTEDTKASKSSEEKPEKASGHRYLLTGGGTGGHVYPAIAIADELRRREPEAEFLYVGVKGKAEEKIVPKRGYKLAFVTSRGWPGGRPSLKLLSFALSLGWGILKSMFILWRFKPTVILATGGYVSAPIMLAWVILARLGLCKAKAFVHEQNLAPGRLNLLVGKLAHRVGLSFAATCPFFPNGEWLGYPVRKEVGDGNGQNVAQRLGIPDNAKVILAFGGSIGSRSINRAIVAALPKLLEDPNIWIIHGVGRYVGKDYQSEEDTRRRFEALELTEEQKKRYHLLPYLDPIEDYYDLANLVVCRAGAGTISEVAVCHLPAIIVPKANLPGDHQVMNARALGDKGAAVVLYERTKKEGDQLIDVLSSKELASTILSLIDDEQKLAEMGEKAYQFADLEALSKLTDRIQQLANGHLPPVEKKAQLDKTQQQTLKFSAMTGSQLVSYLSKNSYQTLTDEDHEYLAYRTDGYLASPAWQTRNIGVKLVGLLHLTERLELILFILTDPTPAPLWHRLLGGDRRQVGFIRRNAITVLKQLDIWNDAVRETLLKALTDPYFEVRSNAASAVAHFAEEIGADEAFLKQLDVNIREHNFEVVRAAFFALAEIDRRPETYDKMKKMYLHPNWRIREALLHCLKRFVERGVLSADTVQKEIDQLLLTSTGFVPRFQLRERMLELSKVLKNPPTSSLANEKKDVVASTSSASHEQGANLAEK